MASIRVKFRPSTNATKEGVVFYQLIKDRVCKQITTAYKLYPLEWDNERGIINHNEAAYHRRDYLQNIERLIMKDLNNLQRIISEAGDIEDIIVRYQKSIKECLLLEFSHRIIQELQGEGRAKTALSHKTTIRSFFAFCEREDVAFDEIKPLLIKQYEQYLKSKKICNNSISFYIRTLRSIYNRAVAEGVIEQRFPFKGIYLGSDRTVKRAVDEQIISRLRALDLSKRDELALARDMFMFSFFARGMAFVDVAHLSKDNIKGDYIVYQRHKTGQELNIRLEPCLKNIITRYLNKVIDNKYLFPILVGINPNYESALRLQNKRLKKISELMGLDSELTSYVARHSWATLAKKRGIPTQVISESMGHNNEKTTLIYLSSLDRSVIDQANAKLISQI